jgi:hypothetical protein
MVLRAAALHTKLIGLPEARPKRVTSPVLTYCRMFPVS